MDTNPDSGRRALDADPYPDPAKSSDRIRLRIRIHNIFSNLNENMTHKIQSNKFPVYICGDFESACPVWVLCLILVAR
jgi:hypothetical protein